MRRGNFQDDTVDYAAVGSTQADDLLQFPPERSLPAADARRIGSGEERFRAASEALLGWAAQRAVGEIVEVKAAADAAYTGVDFDVDGTPVAPAELEGEQRFDADGLPLVSSGATISLRGRVRGHRVTGDYRVVSLTETSRRVSFALGTVSGAVVSGEELFALTWREDDEVWLELRAFDHPTRLFGRMFKGLIRSRRRVLFDRYLRTISPLYKTP